MKYPVISVEQTGKRIREACEIRGIRAKEIQDYMGFSAVQSVYDWFRGKNLPTLDNLYALSRLLGVPMEALVAASDQAESRGRYELAALRCRRDLKIIMRYRQLLSISL